VAADLDLARKEYLFRAGNLIHPYFHLLTAKHKIREDSEFSWTINEIKISRIKAISSYWNNIWCY
jgi:hypothetical protein